MLTKYIFPQLSILFCVLFFSTTNSTAATSDTRSDSFNVTHYSISLDLSNLSTKTLSGSCKISGVSVINGLNRLSLELYKLNVDSVTDNGKDVPYFYNDSLITVKPITPYNTGDSFSVIVWYHGKPFYNSWGGFYFDASNNYAFNLGIGLNTNPHNLGRAWFPCVDDFIDKATFSFFIKSKNTHKAFCNGLLIDSVWNSDNTLTWHWEMRQPIVPYLASVAIGIYKTVYSSFKSISGATIPIMIGILPGDSTIEKVSFQHLNKVLAEYENAYGPYPFDRVGFVGVNFGSGAMEHATNITLPNAWIEGGLSDEYLWAHELSHQWWGDHVTCSSAQDMWLNEGWACYNEGFYQQKLYNQKSYDQYAMGTRYEALRYAHIIDSTDRAVSPMPTEYTYGPTIYDKGSCMVRSLRNYLGDSLFFIGTMAYQHNFANKSASSTDFENLLSTATGINMTEFFNDWIFGKGWPHYEINGLLYLPNGHIRPKVELRTVDNNFKYSNTPLTLNSFDLNWKRTDITFTIDSFGNSGIQLPVNPLFFALDMDGKLPDATTKQYATINKTGSLTFNESLITIDVDSLKDSALVYVVHNWIGAERTPNTPKNIKLSSDRYWTVDGILPTGFHANATLQYDGRALSSAYNGGYLDNDFLKGVIEDSIVLMYKPLVGGDWTLLNVNTDYTKAMGSNHTDEFGNIKILNLKKGQYAFGVYDIHAGIVQSQRAVHEMALYPNPSRGNLTINFSSPIIINSVQIFDTNGKMVMNDYQGAHLESAKRLLYSDLKLPNGTYLVRVISSEGDIFSDRFVIEK